MPSVDAAEAKQPDNKNKQQKQQQHKGADDDSSDDDVPIAQLVQQKQKAASASSGSGSAGSGSAGSGSGRTPRAAAVKAAAKPVVDADSSDDDDVPIAQIVAAAAKKKVKAEKAEAKATATKKRKIPAEQKPAKKAKAVTGKKRTSMKHRTEAFYETEKGALVQSLLCRWWYAMEWPRESDLRPAPEGYEVLDGFRGVYICTRADNLGHIVDTRNKDNAPTFENFSRMTVVELKRLLAQAYENQIRQLVEHEGENTKLERQLRSQLSKVKRA